MAQIIRPDGTTEEIVLNEKDSLTQMQEIVGGYIEIVPVKDGKTLVVNEEGLLKNLPLNYLASKIRGDGDIIVGIAILCSAEELEDKEEEEEV